jgi:predicted nucleic acid-binding Zn ribbon protein
MYCANCGTPLGPGLSYCNRCGNSLKERDNSKNTTAITAFLTAITLLGIVGLGIMLGGALTLRKDAQLNEEIVALFMMMVFAIVGITEFLLIRQLSRLTGSTDATKSISAQPAPNELRPPNLTALPEPLPSVTENTTRTLEYSRREQ